MVLMEEPFEWPLKKMVPLNKVKVMKDCEIHDDETFCWFCLVS